MLARVACDRKYGKNQSLPDGASKVHRNLLWFY